MMLVKWIDCPWVFKFHLFFVLFFFSFDFLFSLNFLDFSLPFKLFSVDS